MNKTFKKICGAVCTVALSVGTLIGCNVVTTDTAKYYNQTVITVGDTSYTKRQLIDEYYSYAYNYVNNGVWTAEAGIKNSATRLVDRGLLVSYLKAEYFKDGGAIGPLTDNDYKSIRKSAFEAMQGQLDSLEDTIKTERNISTTDNDGDEQEDDKPLRDEYKEYTPTVVAVADEQNKIHYVYNNDLIEDDLITEDVPEHFVQKINDAAISKEAWVRYVASLQSVAKAEGKSVAEADVVRAEENRLIELYTNNKYITKFESYYKINEKFGTTITIDGVKYYELNSDISDKAIRYVTNLYNKQKQQYDVNLEAYYTAMKDTSSTTPIVYHPVEGKYMNVTHILLQFSDVQKAEVTKLKKEKETTDMSDEEYQTKLNDIASRTMVKYNDETGAVVTASAAQVYANILAHVNTSTDPVVRAKLFNDMIYMYNDDPGIMNKDFDYKVDLDDNIYGTEDNPTNIMVREFTLAARELYNDSANHGAGNMSELVITDYGYHIIMNTGAVSNMVNDIDLLSADVLNQLTTQLNGYKTWLQYAYDKVASSSNYDTYVSDLVSNLKSNVQIVYYENRYKDLWK